MAIITVTNTNDDLLPGSLRAAISSAMDGDTIVFDSSLNGKTIFLTLGELSFGTFGGTTLTIQGPGSNLLTVSGSSLSRVFSNPLGKIITISGLTVTGGNGVGPDFTTTGGGILNLGTLTLIDLQVITNSATLAQGGGIYNLGTFTLNNSLIKNNTAIFGAGIANDTNNLGIPVILNNSKITENTASNFGGGIVTGAGKGANAGNLTLNNMIVSNNLALDPIFGGGGIYVAPKNLVTINNSIISGNNAVNGGGIFNTASNTVGITSQTVNLNYSTLSTNVASGTGGAIFNASGTVANPIVNLINTTVTGNSAATTGGISNSAGTVTTLTNSIIDGNVNSDISGPYTASPVGSNYISGNPS